ncbi:MAG: hypothetical protein IMF08_07980 [Proteobacteria bacterium]|nr:hypothetical protein [Pseudomonadota bacterium]MCK4868931.1 hypothetical protein [Alphaproteobacteria bacterium]
MNRRETMEERVRLRIARSKSDVFLRGDFENIGGYDQIGRVLRGLVRKDELLKVGYGLYAKTDVSPLSGKIIPRVSLPEIAGQTLRKLKVRQVISDAERAYNEGGSTQVPTGRVIAVEGRISRKIGYDGKYVTFERA